MANFGDFTSLLELAVASGIGFSLFRAPFDLRSNSIGREIDARIDGLANSGHADGQGELDDLYEKKIRLIGSKRAAEPLVKGFICLSLLGALINMTLLIEASRKADQALTDLEQGLIILFSVGWFAILYLLAEFSARSAYGEVRNEVL